MDDRGLSVRSGENLEAGQVRRPDKSANRVIAAVVRENKVDGRFHEIYRALRFARRFVALAWPWWDPWCLDARDRAVVSRGRHLRSNAGVRISPREKMFFYSVSRAAVQRTALQYLGWKKAWFILAVRCRGSLCRCL